MDNLQGWNYADHVTYMLNIAQYSSDHWDIDFDYIELFNEPMSNWWQADNNQEGCHFAEDSQAKSLLLLSDELQKGDRGGLSHLKITASDENSYTLALSTWESFNASVQQSVTKVNVHGYEYGDGRRDLLFDAVSATGKTLWNSEYGDGDSSGRQHTTPHCVYVYVLLHKMTLRYCIHACLSVAEADGCGGGVSAGRSMVRNLNLDFEWLHNSAWVYWQVYTTTTTTRDRPYKNFGMTSALTMTMVVVVRV